MAAQNVGLVQLFAAAGTEQKSRLAVANELNQQLSHIARKVDFSFPIFRLEVVVNLAVPCFLVNDDACTPIENLFDADTAALGGHLDGASQAAGTLENIQLAEKMAERMETERRSAIEMQVAKEVQDKLLPQSAPVLKTRARLRRPHCIRVIS